MNDTGNQVSPAVVGVGEEGPSPNCKNDDHTKSGANAAEMDSLYQAD
jgi:hypothetical protein